MKFLADESCAGPLILALREAGHDVPAIADLSRGLADDQVMERALSDRRVIITEDRDFGELVFARRSETAGVLFVKFPSAARASKPFAVVEAVAKLNVPLHNCFVVGEPGRVRIARRPPG